jgi:hypothetical protein
MFITKQGKTLHSVGAMLSGISPEQTRCFHQFKSNLLQLITFISQLAPHGLFYWTYP